jgi:hypothetical protein|tara:strand:- start:264 stop:557 length:294 start_codon:yes stop_codon:yes gene_type:complete
MEIEITIEEIIKLMKAFFGEEQKFEKPKLRTKRKVHQAPVAAEQRAPWSQKEKAWLFAQEKPVKDNNYHMDELKKRFGVKRTDKSISSCWRRLHDKN